MFSPSPSDLVPLLALLPFAVQEVVAQIDPVVNCQATLAQASNMTDGLFAQYWNVSGASYDENFNGALQWQEGTLLEDIYALNLALFQSGVPQNSSQIHDVMQDTIYAVPFTTADALSVLATSNDDRLWVALALWKYADWLDATGQNSTDAKASAQELYDFVSQPGNWDSTCGGIKWDLEKVYVNSITNFLYVLTGAEGYRRTGNDTMLAQAIQTWDWIEASGLRNAQGVYNDGLTQDGTCVNNANTAWVYIQGTAASALGALYAATNGTNATLLEQAEITLDAVALNSTNGYLSNGTLLEPACEDLANSNWTCPYFPGDQQLYKGLFLKELQRYLELANSSTSTAKYQDFISTQHSSVFARLASSPDQENVSPMWASPSLQNVTLDVLGTTAGIEAVTAAMEFGACESG